MMAWPSAASASTRVALVGDPAADGGITLERPVRAKLGGAVDLSGLNIVTDPASMQVTVIVESVGFTGDDPTEEDNDYTRIDNGIQAVKSLGDGTIVRLVGEFDWTEEFAYFSWMDAGYAVMAPTGVEDVVITASALGDAVIIGPEDLMVYTKTNEPLPFYEGFLYMSGGRFRGWTIENLVVQGFDIPIGMFYDGSARDFERVTVRGNRFEMTGDMPGNFDKQLGEPGQNIAIHLGPGQDQTVEGNEIVFETFDMGEFVAPDQPLMGANVGVQFGRYGNDDYDGLSIVDNLFRVIGVQGFDPPSVYGVWENAAANRSNIEVSGNVFVNEQEENDPEDNNQVAFLINSHSSENTTVTYANNTVTGANVAMLWWQDFFFKTAKALGDEPVVLVGNNLEGNYHGVRVRGEMINGPDSAKALDPSGLADLRYNRFFGNEVAVVADEGSSVLAQNNWWGCNDGPGAPDCDGVDQNGESLLETYPWLVLSIATKDTMVEIGSDAIVTASLRMNSDFEDLGEIAFPELEVDFSAVRGDILSPAATVDGAAATTFTGVEQGLGSATAFVDNASATTPIAVTLEGVVVAESTDESGDTPSLNDNDYTRINDLVQLVEDGVVIQLAGTFDWTEPFAAISWGRGSDGEVFTEDDYSLHAPPGFEYVTVAGVPFEGDRRSDRPSLPEERAVIIGPGDLPNVEQETFLGMWGGSYSGWAVVGLDIRGFDLAIGMFDRYRGGIRKDIGGSFDDIEIYGNRIEIPPDVPGTPGYEELRGEAPLQMVGEPTENIGVRLGPGIDQAVVDNEFVIPGTASSDTSNEEMPLRAISVAIQTEPASQGAYDYLLILGNLFVITGAQADDAEWVYGFQEHLFDTESEIAVVFNSFVNENEGNDPEVNRQRAFSLTSHSGESSQVIYYENLVEGANIGFQWGDDQFEYSPPFEADPVVLESNSLVGNGVGVWVRTDGVEPPPDGSTSDAKVAFDLSSAALMFNRFYGNGIGLWSDDSMVEANNNWWGCNSGPQPGGDAPAIEGCVGDSILTTGDAGYLELSNWLELRLETESGSALLGEEVGAAANLNFNSDDNDTSEMGSIMFGTPILFGATGGSMSPSETELSGGAAESDFTAGNAVGEFEISATVDGQTVSNGISVYAEADLAVTVDPQRQGVAGGGQAVLTITFTNNGPLPVTGAAATVAFGVELAGASWTCSGDEGTVCTESGTGDINDLVDLPVDASVVYTATVTAPDPLEGTLEISAEVTPPADFSDPDEENNIGVGELRVADLLEDGFESGDTTAWSDTVPSEDP